MQSIEFKVKSISYPHGRQSADKNVPLSSERYHVSCHLRRDDAMRYMSSHNYKGNRFFQVLGLYKQPALNAQITQQLTLKIQRHVEKEQLSLNDIVIVTTEVRGIPAASQVAKQLNLPLFIIRKKDGFKMAE